MKQYENYLSDEELNQLIEQVETNEMVEAPEYLTEQIMGKMHEKTVVKNDTTKPATVLPPQLQKRKKPPRSKRQELVLYGVKVIASAAASIAILIALPVTGGENRHALGEALGQINVQTSQICSFLNESTNKIVTYQGGYYDQEEK